MGSIYSKDELMDQLAELRNKRDLVQKNRVAILERYTRKATQEKKEVEAGIELHQLELRIEDKSSPENIEGTATAWERLCKKSLLFIIKIHDFLTRLKGEL